MVEKYVNVVRLTSMNLSNMMILLGSKVLDLSANEQLRLAGGNETP